MNWNEQITPLACVRQLTLAVTVVLSATAFAEWAQVRTGKGAQGGATPLYPERHFERLSYNTPGTTELGCGYLSKATPFDADGDGDWDIDAGGNGYNGQTRFYENPGKANVLPGVFKAGVRPFKVGHCRFAMRADGGYTLTGPDTVSYSLPDGRPGPFRPLGVGTNNVHWCEPRANSWLTKDFDGDGLDDILVGVGHWKEYGWDNAYDGLRRAWKNGRCRGLVYLLHNVGTQGKPKWSEPELVRIENGEPVETMGNPHPMLEDWDGDGDLDLILSDFPGSYTYFENIGTRTKPVYTSGRLLHDSKGHPFAAAECIPFPQAIDWDHDGKLDIVAAQEDSRVGFCRNTGKFWKGMPVFDPPVFLRAEREFLHFGILVSPYVCDFDGDGDEDIVVGDAAGYLAWFENISGPRVAKPKWEGPHYLSCEAPSADYHDVTICPDTLQCSPFKHRAGHNGSIQGPVEAGFGYTCESVADWDGDGDLDVIYNGTWGKPMLLENIGTRKNPRFAAPRGIEVEWGPAGQPHLAWEWLTPERTGNPKELVTQWRTTPLMCDLNGDGLMDLVMADDAGYLAFFERYRDAAGKLRLKAPRRAFVDDATGKPMGVTGWREGNGRGQGGGSGRRKICLADWDGDGRLDLIMNANRNLVLWRQVCAEDGNWRFARQGEFTDEPIAAHSPCPSACDFDGDGIVDIVLGGEDGFLYHFANPKGKRQ